MASFQPTQSLLSDEKLFSEAPPASNVQQNNNVTFTINFEGLDFAEGVTAEDVSLKLKDVIDTEVAGFLEEQIVRLEGTTRG